jgi:transposase-like protein
MDKQSKMYQLVREWKESGLSGEAFAQQHGISFYSLEYWYRKLKKDTGNLPIKNKSKNKPSAFPSFIEIKNNSVSDSSHRLAQVEFELPGGLRVKIY